MDEDWFWDIIERADQDRDRLRAILTALDKDGVYRFQDTFVELSTELQDEPHRMYLDEDESEDGLEDIAHWVVSQGRAKYQEVLDQPELMPGHVDVPASADLFQVGYDVYFERFGEDLDVM